VPQDAVAISEGVMKIRFALTLAGFCLALAPAAGRADPQQDRQACMNDVFIVCAAFIPDRDRVANCLISHRSRISLACREALKHFNPHTASSR
jgi:hypothetical protein